MQLTREQNFIRIKKLFNQLISKGDLVGAKSLMVKYEAAFPYDTEIASMKAILFASEGFFEKARSVLEEALQKQPDDADILYNLGFVSEQMGQFSDCLSYYLDASLYAKNDDVSEEILSALDRVYKISKVKEDFSQLVGSKAISHLNALINLRRYDEVIVNCNNWIKMTKEQYKGFLYYFIGIANNSLGKHEDALENHQQSLEIDKYLADIRFGKDAYMSNYDETEVNCIGCGCSSYKVVWVGNQSGAEINYGLINPLRQWVECIACGLVYANPLPSLESLSKYYSLLAKEKFGGKYGDISKRLEFLVGLSNERVNIIESLSDGMEKTLLDVGAGIGVFIGTARNRGWNASGLELTPEDCKYALDNFGLELMQENFYNFSQEKKYNVITLFEVIEHLHNPLDDLKKLNTLLRQDGLFVVATPILDSLYAKNAKEKDVFWLIPGHLSYFRRGVLEDYLKKSGFEIVKTNMSREGMGRMEFYCRKVKDMEENI